VSAPPRVWSERNPGVLWKAQCFVQIRVVEDVPEPIDCVTMSLRLIGKQMELWAKVGDGVKG
jgi:hypothetical protein